MQIYKITNLLNNKVYIGKDESDRKDYFGSGKLIRRDINKYGLTNFTKEVIEECKDSKTLQEREKYWIKKYQSQNLEIGYNISPGGHGGDTISNNPNRDKIVEKMSKTLQGRIFTEEHRENLIKNHPGLSHRGKFSSDEEYEKWLTNIRKVHTKRKGKTLEEIVGKDRASEVKEHLKSKRAERADQFNMKVGKYSKDGLLLTIYNSQQEASIAENIRQSDISNCITGRQKTVKGFIWKELLVDLI